MPGNVNWVQNLWEYEQIDYFYKLSEMIYWN